MRAVLKAREVRTKDGADEKGKGRDKKKKAAEKADEPPPPQQKNAYSADVIKKLGFDPTARAGFRNESDVKKKVCLRITCRPSSHTSLVA